MRKAVLITGLMIFLLGILLEFLAGAILPGNIIIPLIYGSNQTIWLFVAFAGIITGVVGIILKKK